MDKKRAITAVMNSLERQRSELENGLRSAKQAAAESPSAMESHSDTTRNQMQTLATNMERMAETKASAISSLKKFLDPGERSADAVREGALVETEGDDGKKHFYLVVPEGGSGVTIDENGVSIISITLETPLGSALSGKKKGETAILSNKNGDRVLKIIDLL